MTSSLSQSTQGELPMKWNVIFISAAFLFSAFFSAVSLWAQEEGERHCGRCRATGKIDRSFRKSVIARESDVIYCSEWLKQDGEGYCLDWEVCEKCSTSSAQASARQEHAAEVSRRSEWLAKRREEVDTYTRSDVIHIQTEHFVISWDLSEIEVGRKTLDRHAGAHLYAERAEEIYDYLLEWLGLTERMMMGTMFKLNILERQQSARDLSPYMTGLSLVGSGKIQVIGPKKSNLVMWGKKSEYRKDVDLHQAFVHMVTHHLIHDIALGRYKFWLFDKYGWAYEGTAYILETRLFGTPQVTCSQETLTVASTRETPWDALVKKAVLSGEYPSFQEVIGKSVSTMTEEDRRMSWSYFDYLTWLDAEKLPRMISMMISNRAPTRECLNESYGLTIGQFVDGWTDFVRKNYSTRGKKGPYERSPKVAER